jgi:hypothetical protein
VLWELPKGEIRLTLFPKAASELREDTKIVWEASMTTFSDTKQVIRRAGARKRRGPEMFPSQS